MALTGQLSDMSLAELIEFFCNQRKTGRLKIDYQRGHSVFFIKDGELVDAKVGTLSGVDAVYFSLTLPNAAFDFSPDVQATRRTINDSWTQVVLEGLRRLDEGLSPTEADAFGNFSPTEAEMVSMFDQVERLGDPATSKATAERRAAQAETHAAAEPEAAPLSMMVEAAGGERGGRKKWMVMGVAAAVVLVCAVAAIPLSGAFGSKGAGEAAPAAVEATAPAPAAPAEAEAAAPAPDAAEPTADATAETAATEAEAADAARRERERRERREREERERRAEDRAQNSEGGEAVVPKPAATPAAGPKSVRVTVSYDENGRVTQASVAGASPGAEAYGSTAVRIARGRRFPAGKAGSTVVTIPVN
jgi:TonB family protein